VLGQDDKHGIRFDYRFLDGQPPLVCGVLVANVDPAGAPSCFECLSKQRDQGHVLGRIRKKEMRHNGPPWTVVNQSVE
jgi:hypothetical protein